MRALTLALVISLAAVGRLSAQNELELLQSRKAADLATAAYSAAEKRLEPVARRIAELAKTPPETDEDGELRAHVFRAFCDALIRCGVAVDAATLMSLATEGVPANMLLVLASLDPSSAEPWLWKHFDGEQNFERWSLCIGLLARARSGSLAARLLADADIEIKVSVGSKGGQGFGGMRSGRFTAPKGKPSPEGFPPLMDYDLGGRGRPDDVPLGLEDPFPAFAKRCTLGKAIVNGAKTKGDWRVPIGRRRALEQISGVAMPKEVLDDLEFSMPADATPEAVYNRTQVAREAYAAWYWEVVRGLLDHEVIDAKSARRLRPKFKVMLEDGRDKGAKRIKKLDPKIARPQWVETLK